MKRICICLLTLLLVGCSGSNSNKDTDFQETGVDNNFNLKYKVDDHQLKADDFKVDDLIVFEYYDNYLYLKVEGLDGYDGVLYNNPKSRNNQIFLFNENIPGEYLVNMPYSFLEGEEKLYFCFWKNDNDRVFITADFNKTKMCVDEDKINEIKSKFLNTFINRTYIDLSKDLIIDDSNYKPNTLNINQLFVSTVDNKEYSLKASIETDEYLNLLLSVITFDEDRGYYCEPIDFILSSENLNLYEGIYQIDLSSFNKPDGLLIEIWPNNGRALSITIPIELLNPGTLDNIEG